MTDVNCRASTGSYRVLSVDELDAVAGGGAKAAAALPKSASGQLFEVNDYSFDIEQVLNIGS